MRGKTAKEMRTAIKEQFPQFEQYKQLKRKKNRTQAEEQTLAQWEHVYKTVKKEFKKTPWIDRNIVRI